MKYCFTHCYKMYTTLQYYTRCKTSSTGRSGTLQCEDSGSQCNSRLVAGRTSQKKKSKEYKATRREGTREQIELRSELRETAKRDTATSSDVTFALWCASAYVMYGEGMLTHNIIMTVAKNFSRALCGDRMDNLTMYLLLIGNGS